MDTLARAALAFLLLPMRHHRWRNDFSSMSVVIFLIFLPFRIYVIFYVARVHAERGTWRELHLSHHVVIDCQPSNWVQTMQFGTPLTVFRVITSSIPIEYRPTTYRFPIKIQILTEEYLLFTAFDRLLRYYSSWYLFIEFIPMNNF